MANRWNSGCIIAILALALAVVARVDAQVGPGVSCDNIVPISSTNHYDLTSLRIVSPLTVSADAPHNETTYQMAFCEPLPTTCPFTEDQPLSKCAQPGQAAVCQTTNLLDVTNTFCDGQYSTAEYKEFEDADGYGLSVRYYEGDPCADCTPQFMSTHINIYCAPTPTPIFFSAQRMDAPVQILIKMRHHSGCPVGAPVAPEPVAAPVAVTLPPAEPITPIQPLPNQGLSGGSVLLIILFVGAAVYLIGGILINKFAFHASGLEMIPHVQMWSQLPGLVKDGFNFITCRAPSVAEYRHV